jgi:hypothetical protein
VSHQLAQWGQAGELRSARVAAPRDPSSVISNQCAVDPAKEHVFITAFLERWGAAITRRKGRRQGS